MILHKITFGKIHPSTRQEAEDMADDYLRMLSGNGQAGSGYAFVAQDGLLCAYIDLAGNQATKLKYHNNYGREQLKNVIAWFGQDPVWERLDDYGPWRDTIWTNAPFLFLTTCTLDGESPLFRGDTGARIPLYRLPDHQVPPDDRLFSKDDIFFGAHKYRADIGNWQHSYHNHDSVWMRSGKLEFPAYKQLAFPDSELSETGRDLCKHVESATGVPTYYYLHRYYGRPEGEAMRKCPGCGRRWRTRHPLVVETGYWHRFAFKCDKCRLVSHVAADDDEPKYAHIGEWRAAKK